MKTQTIKGMKSTLCLMGCLMLPCATWAASFDCSRAQTKVEKLICSDAELSKLDEDLAIAYKTALKASDFPTSLRLQSNQKQWLKKRDDCTAERCVKNSYEARLSSLENSINSKQAGIENSPELAQKTGASNQKICTEVSDTLLRISKLPPQHYVDPFYVDSIEISGRTHSYQNVDLDGDGKFDKVEQSCGSPSDGTCTLYVSLSSGGGYELNEEIFHLMRVRSRYFVLVGHPSAMKNHRYLLP